jgi:hypothetical protein
LKHFRLLAVIFTARSAIEFIVGNNAPTLLIRYVMGLRKLRDFLVERGQPWLERYKSWQLGASGTEF